MSETYKRVDASHYRNIWVVGDLHGCYQNLMGQLVEIKGADKFIFGHTAVNRVTNFKNQMYIDTGAVFTGRLTLLQIQGEQHKRMP